MNDPAEPGSVIATSGEVGCGAAAKGAGAGAPVGGGDAVYPKAHSGIRSAAATAPPVTARGLNIITSELRCTAIPSFFPGLSSAVKYKFGFEPVLKCLSRETPRTTGVQLRALDPLGDEPPLFCMPPMFGTCFDSLR